MVVPLYGLGVRREIFLWLAWPLLATAEAGRSFCRVIRVLVSVVSCVLCKQNGGDDYDHALLVAWSKDTNSNFDLRESCLCGLSSQPASMHPVYIKIIDSVLHTQRQTSYPHRAKQKRRTKKRITNHLEDHSRKSAIKKGQVMSLYTESLAEPCEHFFFKTLRKHFIFQAIGKERALNVQAR